MEANKKKEEPLTRRNYSSHYMGSMEEEKIKVETQEQLALEEEIQPKEEGKGEDAKEDETSKKVEEPVPQPTRLEEEGMESNQGPIMEAHDISKGKANLCFQSPQQNKRQIW